MRRIAAGLVALAATLALVLTGCSGSATSSTAPGSTGPVKIAVVTPYLANAATKESIDDLKAQAEKLGWQVTVTDTAGDMNRLNSAFQDAAAQKPTAIVMASGDPTQASLGLKSAKDAGVPVYAMDAAPVDGITANVTSDNTDLGKKSAEALIKAMGNKGSIIMLTHDPHPGVNARAKGAEEVFKAKGITVLQKIHVNVPGPVENARKSVQDAISSQGDKINGIWGGWDEPALGAVQALNAATKKVPVVGVDGQDFALAEIKKGGNFKATIKQDWMAISAKVIELIKAQAEAGKAPEKNNYELPGKLIDK